jgi:DNA modification methylase
MPPDLAERCLLAGSAICDTVLDPFGGAGTTALAAIKNGRSAVLIELNSRYCTLAKQRLGVPFDAIDWFNLAAAARDSLTKAIIR